MAVLSPVFASPSQWRFDEPAVACWLGGFAIVSALSYVLNFRLQSIAGPVVFSQIGYWGTGFGIVLAAVLFGDVLTMLSLVGLAAMIIGGVFANRHR
jgi:drug/metabolite transporter (DMT)-like permease